MAALITGIVFLIFFGKPNRHRLKDPIRNFSTESNAPDNRLEARSKHAILHTVGHTNRVSLTESTNSPPLQLVEEVGNQFPKYVEIKKILTGYDVCRTNPELAHRLTFETYADLGNAYDTATEAFSDILWDEQTAQNRHFGSGSEMINPTNSPSIMRAVERISEARRHRAMAIERLERFGITLSGSDRLSLLTTEPKESILIMKDLVPRVEGLED